jgi:hypothetical protein
MKRNYSGCFIDTHLIPNHLNLNQNAQQRLR